MSNSDRGLRGDFERLRQDYAEWHRQNPSLQYSGGAVAGMIEATLRGGYKRPARTPADCPRCGHPWSDHYRKGESLEDPELSGCSHAKCNCFYVTPADRPESKDEGPKQTGPSVTTVRSCNGCRHVKEERYAAQGDSGFDVSCALAERQIGDTTWATPEWCPVSAPSPARESGEDESCHHPDWDDTGICVACGKILPPAYPRASPPAPSGEGRDWYIEARVGSANYRGEVVKFIRDGRAADGTRTYENRPAEEVVAGLFSEIARLTSDLAAARAERDGWARDRDEALKREQRAERERDEARAQAERERERAEKEMDDAHIEIGRLTSAVDRRVADLSPRLAAAEARLREVEGLAAKLERWADSDARMADDVRQSDTTRSHFAGRAVAERSDASHLRAALRSGSGERET